MWDTYDLWPLPVLSGPTDLTKAGEEALPFGGVYGFLAEAGSGPGDQHSIGLFCSIFHEVGM